jgi:hypothetical protein
MGTGGRHFHAARAVEQHRVDRMLIIVQPRCSDRHEQSASVFRRYQNPPQHEIPHLGCYPSEVTTLALICSCKCVSFNWLCLPVWRVALNNPRAKEGHRKDQLRRVRTNLVCEHPRVETYRWTASLVSDLATHSVLPTMMKKQVVQHVRVESV